ncbi:MAG: cation transporter, partial [Frankiales bacterium]|nr:cation transporter [Frankiales bacterium]
HEHHDHEPHPSLLSRLRHAITPHSHDAVLAVDSALESSDRGPRALVVSLLVLLVAAAIEAVVAALSGSVALLGDTLHNAADAFTAVPLGVAFWLGRRAPTRRYTYGFGRAEDLAGVVIVLLVAGSSAFAAYEAVHRLVRHAHITHLWTVAVAGVVGFAANEIVARYRIKVGREIGSAALVADGLHARTDALTSLAVVAGAGGTALGWRWADPAVGLVITVAILLVLRTAARDVYRRLMDAVDPHLVHQIDDLLLATPGVSAIGVTRVRWIGHQLRAECTVVVDADLSVVEGHRIAVDAEHRLLHGVPRLTGALVHADPAGEEDHVALRHHQNGRSTAQ